jgi:hypothetical protein
MTQIPKSLKRYGKCQDPSLIANASRGKENENFFVSYFRLSRNFGAEHRQEKENEKPRRLYDKCGRKC